MKSLKNKEVIGLVIVFVIIITGSLYESNEVPIWMFFVGITLIIALLIFINYGTKE